MHVYDIQVIALYLQVVESTCVVDSYTVVDTPRTPVHNNPCPLHWVHDTPHYKFLLKNCHELQSINLTLFAWPHYCQSANSN